MATKMDEQNFGSALLDPSSIVGVHLSFSSWGVCHWNNTYTFSENMVSVSCGNDLISMFVCIWMQDSLSSIYQITFTICRWFVLLFR